MALQTGALQGVSRPASLPLEARDRQHDLTSPRLGLAYDLG